MRGSLREEQVRVGVPRGRAGLFQRRAKPRVFGEPRFECELVPEAVHPERPHVVAWSAWVRMVAAAEGDGVETRWLGIHSAYRSVALQREVFEYRVEERRRLRAEQGLPELPRRELERLQTTWTARPGTSAHHTGLALDLALYELGKRGSKRSPVYAWLAVNARRFGFYPYLPEGWHWEFNPPGLVRQLAELRRRLADGEPFEHLLVAPDPIPVAAPRSRG